MNIFRTIPLLLLITIANTSAQELYTRFFTENTMRVDVYHTGTKGEELITLDEVYREGPWPGSRINLIDTLNLGEYLFIVYDAKTNIQIYSRGYSTIFNEWQTTDDALQGKYHAISETVRFPFPRRAVKLEILRRDKRMVFRHVFDCIIDPNDPTRVNVEKRAADFPVVPIMENGPPREKVDILILGDGYTQEDMEKFREDARHFSAILFDTEPFKDRKEDFNVWTIEVASRESGIDIPDKNIWKNTALGCTYNTFGSARYVLTEKNKELRDIAGAAPYDFITILVNDNRYGGGGIFNLYTTTYTKVDQRGQEWQMDYVYVHEFGHSFGGLGDEYYSSSTGYNDFYQKGIEPWEPNITALLDPDNIKWKSLLTPGIEIPTKWGKAQYDSLENERRKLDRLAEDYYEKREPLLEAARKILNNPDLAGKVGAFEGAGYSSTGLYRPSLDCRMFSLSLKPFDPVCTASIIRMIDFYAR
ncbi:MAG: peptidase M64 [Chlorobi bacterium]|nr:peptidase M64 [Chlorobiota bacterium]